MASGRFYTIQFSGVSVSAVQDLISYKAASGKPFVLHSVTMTQDSVAGDSNSKMLRFSIAKAAGSYTAGSGGTTPTPVPHNASDTAAGGTTHANDTTRAAAGTGTLTRIITEAQNIQNGWTYLPTPEMRIMFQGGEAAVVGLETAPAGAENWDGWMVIEEFG